MKLSINSFSLLLATVLAGNMLFISCNDENNDPAKTPTPQLATASYYHEDGTLDESESFSYDSKGRLVEMNSDNDYKVVFEYSTSTVTLKEYDKNVLRYTQVFSLDPKGFCISSLSDDGTTTYTYDANGYRKTMVDNNENSTYTQTFTVANGNYVTVVTEDKYITPASSQSKKSGSFEKLLLLKTLGKNMPTQNILKSASDEINTHKTDYSFYTDKINTIDFENMGIYFLGKQNKNPVKQETETSTEWPIHTTGYSYEYDSKGRITKKMYDSGDYEVYTYVD